MQKEVEDLINSGGAVLTIPNPQIELVDLEEYDKALDILHSAICKLDKLNTGITPVLRNMYAFYEQRLFLDSPEEVQAFRNNLLIDSTQGESA